MINNRYILDKKIGEGRSKVFLCSDNQAGGKKLAIKILANPNADRNEVNSFREEYYILKKLSHPNIINVYELGCVITSDDDGISYGSFFFTLDYFEGISLDNIVFDPGQLNELIKQICSVLFYLHQSNYIYYDLKPENILVDFNAQVPEIKFIDFGFAEHLPDTQNYQPKGTAQYIAPEILKKQPHDFKVDIYSFGILLYKLIYNKYPFDVEDELKIYKAHLESDFEFPELKFNSSLAGVLKKILAKDPLERYDSVLKILVDLQIPITNSITKDFLPAKIFSSRRDVLAMLKKYITDDSTHEVFSIRGYESMGKTFLAEELARIYEDVILLSESHVHTGMEFIRSLMRKIYYHEPSHRTLSERTRNDLANIIDKQNEINAEELKMTFYRLASESDFILVLDGFNLFDEISQELFRELIPILQMNGRRVILTEESEWDYSSEYLNNLQEINISPFTDTNLTEYLAKSFYSQYPAEELRKLILRYADLLPGSIEGFVKDIHLFGIIDYKTGYPELDTREEAVHLLKSSHNEIYEARLKILDDSELDFVKHLSLFEFPVHFEILRDLLGFKGIEENQVIVNLEKKNILQHYQFNREPVFSSSGLKKYIYSTIKNVSELHGNVAFKLREGKAKIGRVELARQFELAGLYDEGYEILKLEIESAEIQSAHSYQKQILLRLLEIPLGIKTINEIKFKLCQVYSNLNDHPAVLKLSDELEGDKLSPELQSDLRLLKGKALYGTGDLVNARELFYNELEVTHNEAKRIKILIELSYIEYDLTGFDKARQLCDDVLSTPAADFEDRGRVFNLIGLIAHSHQNDFDGALENFIRASEMYEKAGLPLSKLKIEINIGNILFISGKIQEGVEYWLKAKETNLSVGNMEYEALIIMNLGALSFNQGNYEEAEENYLKARNVFISIGNKLNYSSLLINLSEIYIETSAFEEANKCLLELNRTLYRMDNYELEADTHFTFGKFYFYLGDFEALSLTVEDYEKIFNKIVLSDRYYNNLSSLKLLTKLNGPDENLIEEFRRVIGNFLEFDDKYNFTKFSFILIGYLMKHNYNKDALDEIMNDALIGCCKENIVHEAERLYWLSVLANSDNNISLAPPNEYLNDAYTIMESQSISDLTWKILFALTEFYKSRGHEVKFIEYNNYLKGVINFIIQQIKNVNLRSKYLNKPERKSALKKIDLWEGNV